MLIAMNPAGRPPQQLVGIEARRTASTLFSFWARQALWEREVAIIINL